MSNEGRDTRQSAWAARAAQRAIGSCEAGRRTAVLRKLASLLSVRERDILAANEQDCEAGRRDGLAPPLLARLALTPAKLSTLRDGLASLAEGDDPVGRPVRRTKLDDGLALTQVMSPLGVLLIIFESRPDAVIQIGGLAIRSGNAVLLKGGAEAMHSNRALVACLRDALESEGFSPDTVVGVEGREAIAELLSLDDAIDLVIPRGSGALVRSIQASTRIPVLGHAEGICMLYLDRGASPEMAAHIAVDGKCDYPAACNATETMLVHEAFLPSLHRVGRALGEAGVTMRADPRALPMLPGAQPAAELDGSTEYGDLTLAVRTVGSIDEAIAYIHRHGSGHTDAIVTDDAEAAERFLREVDSSSVFHNASTRFADGYRFGLGAEVGISTSRIHARGPVGVEGLMTTRWLLRGEGQGASDYGKGGKRFLHERLPLSEDR